MGTLRHMEKISHMSNESRSLCGPPAYQHASLLARRPTGPHARQPTSPPARRPSGSPLAGSPTHRPIAGKRKKEVKERLIRIVKKNKTHQVKGETKSPRPCAANAHKDGVHPWWQHQSLGVKDFSRMSSCRLRQMSGLFVLLRCSLARWCSHLLV